MMSVDRHIKTDCEEELTIGLKIIQKDIEYIKARTEEINKKLENNYVTHIEFEPVKRTVYGFIGLVVTIVVTALVYLVMNK